MKKIIIEAVFILMISLMLSLFYNATSSSGIILLKKAFKIKAEAGYGLGPGPGSSQEALIRYS